VPVIRWGAETSSDMLRERARRTACGHKGATIQYPEWGGADIGFLPFPTQLRCRYCREYQCQRQGRYRCQC
jgi:hypothetical protein